jgi:hypothetical protein
MSDETQKVKAAPSTYICVGGKMIGMVAVAWDKSGKVAKYKADLSSTIDPSQDGAEIAILRKENAEMAKDLAALRDAVDELIGKKRTPKKDQEPA